MYEKQNHGIRYVFRIGVFSKGLARYREDILGCFEIYLMPHEVMIRFFSLNFLGNRFLFPLSDLAPLLEEAK